MRIILATLFPALLLALTLHTPGTLAENTEYSPETAEGTQEDKVRQDSKPSSEITLEQILERYYESIGGDKAWQSIETMKFTGSMYTKETTFKIAALFKRPNICRTDFQAGRLYFIEAFDGKLPWQMNAGTRTGPQILKGKRAKEMIDTCDFDGVLVHPQEKGHKIKYLGIEEVEDQTAYVLEVNTNSGNKEKHYLDTETYLPFMVKGNTTIQDKVVKTTINLSEYMEISDIKIPFSYEYIVDENPSSETLEIKTVELNPELEDSVFMLPKRPQDLR